MTTLDQTIASQASVLLLRSDGSLLLQLDPHQPDHQSEFPLVRPMSLSLWANESPIAAASRSLLQHTNLDHDNAKLMYWRTYWPHHFFVRLVEQPDQLRLHQSAQLVTIHGPRDLPKLNVDSITRRALTDFWLCAANLVKPVPIVLQ